MIEEVTKDQDVDFKVVSAPVDDIDADPEITFWQKAIFSILSLLLCIFIVLAFFQSQRINTLTLENEALRVTITALERK